MGTENTIWLCDNKMFTFPREEFIKLIDEIKSKM